MRFVLWLLLCFYSIRVSALETISIITDEENLRHPVSGQAIEDVVNLLSQACHCPVKLNDRDAPVQFILPQIDSSKLYKPSRFAEEVTFPYLHYPEHHYTWISDAANNRIILHLETPSYHGISFGLYGLLQEQLGFLFYHPKESIIPVLKEWSLPNIFRWEVTPRFDKKGFHLHTMHPLELTEQLLAHDMEGALKDVKQYIDWLARNQQNYFDFNLLESIDLKKWPGYAKQFVEYSRSRGIITGVDVSLHMIQQKAFMLYRNPPASFRPRKKQIERTLEKLFEAPWDVVNVEFSTTEFITGNKRRKQKLQLFLTDLATNQHNAKLVGRKHVVKEDEEVLGARKKEYKMSEAEKLLDSHRGILIHTVMFYTISEEKAPVYQNENLRHLLDLLLIEKEQRETWYYPESAYWITFDNSIPMLHLPYLSARLDDILLMDSLNIPGHITFSSGWEWGYWLIDWSIARWSWKYTMNGVENSPQPTEFLNNIFPNAALENYFEQSLALQQQYVKDQELIRYMAAFSVTDELPGKLNLEFQPRPRWTYKYMRRKANQLTIDTVRNEGVKLLNEYYEKSDLLNKTFQPAFSEFQSSASLHHSLLLNELTEGINITSLRARHRALTLEYLLCKREAELKKEKKNNCCTLLTDATKVRADAMQIVVNREQHYRYPVDLIARKRWTHTAYHYGYLYPVSNLHFWQREEQQACRNRFGPLFMNIWDIPRIIGLVE